MWQDGAGIAQHQKASTASGLLVAAHQLLEGGIVALLRGGDERLVFQRTPLAKSTPETPGWFPPLCSSELGP